MCNSGPGTVCDLFQKTTGRWEILNRHGRTGEDQSDFSR